MTESTGGAPADGDGGSCVGFDIQSERFDEAGHPGSIVPVHRAKQTSVDPDTSENPPHALIDRFLSGFFDEDSIKWLLVIGAGIVFGSSLMLVTREWSHWPVSLKYLTVLAYTAAGFCAAEICRQQLPLRITSLVLQSLTLLLLPILFLSLSWMSTGTATQAGMGTLRLLTLMAPAAALAWFASNRIFDFLLAGRQTTFVISYQLLCVAGIIPQAASPLLAMALMPALWLVFTLGVIKVNRHTFWLAEEQRVAPIFGFFAIALLGLQFLTLVGIKCLPAIPTEWLGFGCVLVAVTVLATARSVAEVFRQRTGDLVRPYPWRIVSPVFAGLVLTSTGVTLSLSGFPDSAALIPATALAAVLMAWTGRDTKQSGFVWMSLLFATMAYQFTPTLFKELALQLRDSAATAVGERKLPIAFYGLTYLPLLTGIALGSRYFRRRANPVFSRPMQQFTTIVLLALFALSVANVKAMLVVGVINVFAFAGMGGIFRDRRYALGSIAAIYAVAWSIIPCMNSVPGWPAIDPARQMTVVAMISAVMSATPVLDWLFNSIPTAKGFLNTLFVGGDGTTRNLCQRSGWIITVVLLGRWMLEAGAMFGEGLMPNQVGQFGILIAAFILYTFRHPGYAAGVTVWIAIGFASLCSFGGVVPDVSTLCIGSSATVIVTSAIGLLGLRFTWCLGHGSSLFDMRRRISTSISPEDESAKIELSGRARQTLAFVVPLCDLSLMTLGCLAVFYHLPALLGICFSLPETRELPLVSRAVTFTSVIWLLIAGILTKERPAAITGTFLLPFCISALIVTGVRHTFLPDWSAVIWAVTAASCYLVARRGESLVVRSVARTSQFWLMAILAMSCLWLSYPVRLAAGVAIASFAAADWRGLSRLSRTRLAMVTNVQLLYLAAALGGLNGLVSLVLTDPDMLRAIPLMLLGAAISIPLFEHESGFFERSIAHGWSRLLRIGVVVLISLAFGPASYSIGHAGIMLTALTITAATEFARGVRRQCTRHIWSSLTMPCVAAMWVLRHGLIDPGAGTSQLALVATAFVCLLASRQCRKLPRYEIAAPPLLATGQLLPGLVALLGVGRVVLTPGMLMPGLHSLAMLAAAAIYFHEAVVTRQRRFALGALGIFDLSVMLLWNSLGLHDAQLYMVPIGLSIIGFVELMKRELPRSSHDLLRYIGALTILVSPTFEIIGGSWLHLLTLMVLSVVIVLLAIGLRLKSLVYTGSAFLLADLAGMVWRTTIDHPGLLWVGGVVLGAAVIAFAAYCENHRDRLRQRIRFLSVELATWR